MEREALASVSQTSTNKEAIADMAENGLLAKKRVGPAPSGRKMQIVVRMPPAPLAAIDDWASTQTDKPTRAEAIRRLVAIGLRTNAQTLDELNEAQSHAAKASTLAAELGLKPKR
jgi:hypothetical protein